MLKGTTRGRRGRPVSEYPCPAHAYITSNRTRLITLCNTSFTTGLVLSATTSQSTPHLTSVHASPTSSRTRTRTQEVVVRGFLCYIIPLSLPGSCSEVPAEGVQYSLCLRSVPVLVPHTRTQRHTSEVEHVSLCHATPSLPTRKCPRPPQLRLTPTQRHTHEIEATERPSMLRYPLFCCQGRVLSHCKRACMLYSFQVSASYRSSPLISLSRARHSRFHHNAIRTRVSQASRTATRC